MKAISSIDRVYVLPISEELLSTKEWWKSKRLAYNLMLIIVGPIAFVLYVIAVFAYVEDAEVSGFTTIFQAFSYLIMIGVANTCYFLGPITESIVKPKDVSRFRKITYRAGYWFSASLPFSIPVSHVVYGLFWK